MGNSGEQGRTFIVTLSFDWPRINYSDGIDYVSAWNAKRVTCC